MSAVPPHVLFATFVRAARFFPRAGDGDHHERTADARLAGARRSSRAARLRSAAPRAERATPTAMADDLARVATARVRRARRAGAMS